MFSKRLILVATLVLVVFTSLLSIPLAHFLLWIPFKNYDTGDLASPVADGATRDFWIKFAVFYVASDLFLITLVVTIFLDFAFRTQWIRRANVFLWATFYTIIHLLFVVVLFDVVNIVLVATNCFGSTNALVSPTMLRHSHFIAFMTLNYLTPWVRVAVIVGVLCVVAVVDAFALYRGHSMVLRSFVVDSPKFQQPFRFAHISDVHFGSRFAPHAQKIVAQLVALHPDFVVITGDLFDSPNVRREDIAPFAALTSSVPVFLVRGNHDYLVEQANLRDLLQFAGITLIDGAYRRIPELGVGLVGCQDDEMKAMLEDFAALAPTIDPSLYNILLHHRPHGFNEVCDSGLVDLMLAGHTHAGQFFPFGLLVWLVFPKAHGDFTIAHGGHTMRLYTSPGTGAWSAHMRTLAKNTVAVFDCRPAAASECI